MCLHATHEWLDKFTYILYCHTCFNVKFKLRSLEIYFWKHSIHYILRLHEAAYVHFSSYLKSFSLQWIATVPLKCNFTHVWLSMHGYMQIFACKVQKMSVEIFIFTRHGVTRDVEYHETWSTTWRGIPRDVKCHETYYVRTRWPVYTGLMRINHS